MDKYEIANEMAKCMHDSVEPLEEWKYLSDSLIDLFHLYGNREMTKNFAMLHCLKELKR